MAAEREVVGDGTARGADEPGRADEPEHRPPPPRATVIWCLVVAVLLAAWFFVAWLALDRHIIDAAGESVGSAFLLLLIASVVGAFRRGRR
jgi:hypothetical protein